MFATLDLRGVDGTTHMDAEKLAFTSSLPPQPLFSLPDQSNDAQYMYEINEK
jgi:hypothetical protein